MNSEEFINVYWAQYLSLEKEFNSSTYYLSIDVLNESAYSQAYAKLILQIGSEVDIVFKDYCKTLGLAFKSKYPQINDYKESIKKGNSDFITQEVTIKTNKTKTYPWRDWQLLDAPYWWTAYNKVKHERANIVEIDGIKQEAYKFANQKYVLLALAGLYQIMVYYHYKLATEENKLVVTPMPGSRLFVLSNEFWDKIGFYGDVGLVYDEKNSSLNFVTSTIPY